MADYYPKTDAGLPPFHTTFNTECINYAPSLSSVLTAGALLIVANNKDTVIKAVNATDEAKNYANEVVAWKEILLRAPKGTPVPAPPTAPVIPSLLLGALPGVEVSTRALVAQIKAHPNYTQAIGQAMGIIGAAVAQGTPSVAAESLSQSQVQLNLTKAGFDVLAIDMRRGGGGWVQIGVANIATYIDNTAPLVAGQPEQREYRVQGIENNVRVGALSGIVSVVTVP